MAKPTQSKEVKPKATEDGDDDAEKGGGGLPVSSNLIGMIAMALVVVICSSAASAASVYFLTPMVIEPMLAHIKPAEGEGGEEGGGEEGEEGEGGEHLPAVGPVIELDEFTVNLKDGRYLRATISISVTADDDSFTKLAGEEAKKWEEEFHGEMAHYVPSLRDICITSLTKRTSTELLTTQGKETLKEEVKQNAEAVFHGERKIIRVNFENFIIQ